MIISCRGPKTAEESIAYLVEDCGLSSEAVERHCRNNELIVLEHIRGIPYASWTGYELNTKSPLRGMSAKFLGEAKRALIELRLKLETANGEGLRHNDPMLPNICLTIDQNGDLAARLVDFELAQDLNGDVPGYVADSVLELYDQREVPKNEQSGSFTMTLDQHLMGRAIAEVERIRLAQDQIAEQGWLAGVEIQFLGVTVSLERLREWSRTIWEKIWRR